MSRSSRRPGASMAAALLLAAVSACTSPVGSPGARPAVDTPRPGWQLVHCGESRGVLYLTYLEHGWLTVAPAALTAEVRRACAEAGFPVAVGAPARVPTPSPTPTSPPERTRTRAEPSFVAQAFGSVIDITARNDGDTAYACVLDFSWTFDDDPSGPRPVTTQATLPARQVNRVVYISGPYRNVRFVDRPRWHCVAVD